MESECHWFPSEEVPYYGWNINSQVDITDYQMAEFSYAYMCTSWCPCLSDRAEEVFLRKPSDRLEFLISANIDRAAIDDLGKLQQHNYYKDYHYLIDCYNDLILR